MAHAAMAEALDQIGAAIPFGRLAGIRLVLALAEVERAPAQDQLAIVIGEAEVVLPVPLAAAWSGREECLYVRVQSASALENYL